jgi:hypothetical protein
MNTVGGFLALKSSPTLETLSKGWTAAADPVQTDTNKGRS